MLLVTILFYFFLNKAFGRIKTIKRIVLRVGEEKEERKKKREKNKNSNQKHFGSKNISFHRNTI